MAITGAKVRERTWRIPPTLPLVFTVPSRSNPFATHTVNRDFDGNWSCSCVGYSYRRTCSHVTFSQDLAERFEVE